MHLLLHVSHACSTLLNMRVFNTESLV